MSNEYGIREQEYSKQLNLSLWRRLLAFTRPYKGAVFTLCAANMLLALGETIFPLFTRYAIDALARGSSAGQMGVFFAGMLALAVLLSGCTFVFIRRAGHIEQYVSYDIRKACFDRLQTLSFSYYDRTPVGYIMARMTGDTVRLSETIAWSLVDVLWAITRIVGATIAMLTLSPTITLWVLIVLPPLAACTLYFQRKIFKAQRVVRRTNSRITGAYNESIMGATTTKSLTREAENLREFSDITDTMCRASCKAAHYNAIYNPLVMMMGSIGTALALWQGGVLVLEGVLWFGTIAAFASYTMQFFEPLQQLARIFAEMQMAQAAAERVLTLLDTQPDIADSQAAIARDGDTFHPKKENWTDIHGHIEFSHVDFAYVKGQEVLRDFNLTIHPGQTVALVGQTGSGKSTIVNLLCRFYEPTGGQIRIDGEDIQSHSQLWLHSQLGYVLQSPHLFSGTIADNIRYGCPEADMERVIRAAKLVSAHAFIQQLPDGYQTQVGEGGNRLSTGQKQLISFARAVLNDPPLFVLDEATSSIDTQTELLIQQAIAATLENRTSVIIAHRLSTIQNADLILVLQHGQIIERGTHAQLLEKRGAYYTLYTHQLLEDPS